jgi:hypothetical protein
LAAPQLAARAEEQAGDLAAELVFMVRQRPDAASSGCRGDAR